MITTNKKLPTSMPREEIHKRFSLKGLPTITQAELKNVLSKHTVELAQMMNQLCPASREASLAFTHLETAVYWAHSSIDRHLHITKK